ncbi:ABC transporter permease [Leifsonia sp. McL0607]|uniref:ABC transporter permease n=1 Tax=Leifsonia sp. McL0607 TaxID=3415672 RepID=UPI003CF720FE
MGVELRKTVRGRIPLVIAVMLVLGVVAIDMAVTLAAAHGTPAVLAKLGPVVGAGGWPGYLNAAVQVTAAGSAGACGILASWSFGREFADGTVAGLFALPVSRGTVAAAKLIAFVLWSVAASIVLTIGVLAGGILVGLAAPGSQEFLVLMRIPVLVVTTALMTIPAAWASTLSRGLLGGIAVTVVLLVSAQIVVFSGGGSWYPPSAPALWALDPTPSTMITLVWGLLLPAAAIWLTALSWRRLQLDR